MTDPLKGRLSAQMEKFRRFMGAGIWELELPTLSRFKAFLVYQMRLNLIVAEGFIKDQCLLRASALTYYTLLSIVPLLATVFIVFRGMGGVENLEGMVREKVRTVLAVPAQVERDADQTALPGAVPEALLDEQTGEQAAAALQEEPPKAQEAAEKVMDTIFGSVERINGGAVGGLGMLVLIFVGIGMLSQIEQAFNFIWGVKKHRSYFNRIAPYLTSLLFGPVLVVTAGFIFTAVSSGIYRYLPFAETIRPIAESFVPFFTALLMIWLAFAMLYFFMPNTRVRIRSALIGGIAGGTLWQITYWGCQIMFTHTAKAETAFKIYGALGALPLFLFWIYANWVVVLFGAEVAFADEHVSTYKQELEVKNASSHLKERLAVRLAWIICETFCKGADALTAQDMAKRAHVPIRLVNEVLYQLVRANMIRETSDETPGYLLARDPERLHIQEVVDAIHKAGDNELQPAGGGQDYVQEILEKEEALLSQSLSDTSLRELWNTYNNNPDTPQTGRNEIHDKA